MPSWRKDAGSSRKSCSRRRPETSGKPSVPSPPAKREGEGRTVAAVFDAARYVNGPRYETDMNAKLTQTPLRHFLDLLDWDADAILDLLKDAARLKKARARGKDRAILQGQVLGMMFEKPSLRTRVSFQAAMIHLGGGSVFLTQHEVGMGTRESLPDCARVLSELCDVLVLRTFEHQTVIEVAKWATVPVINGLSDYYHPCQ